MAQGFQPADAAKSDTPLTLGCAADLEFGDTAGLETCATAWPRDVRRARIAFVNGRSALARLDNLCFSAAMRLAAILFFFTWLALELPVTGASAKNRALADALFVTNRVIPIKIEISADGIRSLRREPRTYVPATIREGDTVYTNLLIHLRGSIGSFRPIGSKAGFTVKVEKGAPRFHGLKKFHFNNSMQDHTYMSEWVCTELFRQAGVPAPRVAHAYVELNGRKLGLYQLKESFNEDFLERYFQKTDGNLYGQPGNADVTEPIERVQGAGENTQADLRMLARSAREPKAAKSWEQLQQTLDVDRFLSFMAMEVMLCHWDGYTFGVHNYRIYHDMDTDKMVFFPHDTDQMIGDSNLAIMPHPAGMVAQAVLRTAEGRRRYRERFALLYTNVFQPAVITRRLDQALSTLVPSLKEFDPRLAADFPGNAAGLKSRVFARAAALDRQLNPPKPLQFDGNVVALRGWKIGRQQGTALLEERTEDAKQVLKISCDGDACNGSWRTTAILEPGRYRFSGNVRAIGIVPRTDTPASGGFLRVSRSPRQGGVLGDAPWTRLHQDFSIDEVQREMMFVCELHALKGEVWFDKESLRLERLP
ncbi:MAG: CotH kinase family protein [Verrucomicrobiales bacterium]|nr:CotH kinase family protein [Verrucomicrobiales bacterium]